MGYTHYYTQQRDLTDIEWDAIVGIVDEIIRFSPVKVHFVADDLSFILNGVNDGFEDFYLTKKNGGFRFCKTAQQPYDLVVCASLIMINAGRTIITSFV